MKKDDIKEPLSDKQLETKSETTIDDLNELKYFLQNLNRNLGDEFVVNYLKKNAEDEYDPI